MQNDLMELIGGRSGHFQLESGHHGSLWLELDSLFLRPKAIERFTALLADQISNHDLQAVCGPLTGGAFIAQMIASDLDCEFYFSERVAPSSHRKNEGLYETQYRIPTALRNSLNSKNVVIVDDVINAGSAVRATLADVQECGGIPVAVAALVVLGDSATTFAANQNIPLEAVEAIESPVWKPSECPLCASGEPLEQLLS